MFHGLFAGIITLITIGVFHPIVIKSEYHFGKKIWPVFLTVGIVLALSSFFIPNIYLSIFIGILAFVCFWSIVELFNQEKRVKKGWFPKNQMKQGVKLK
jgi:hypothetical protein